MKKIFILIFITAVGFGSALAQKKEAKQFYNKGKKHFNKNELSEALVNYKQALSIDTSNANYNYRVGECYYFMTGMRDSANVYFSRATSNVSPKAKHKFKETAAPPEAFFFLGKIYHQNYKFEEAIENLEKYKAIGKNSELLKETDLVIEACQNGISHLDKPLDLIVIEVSGGINSKYEDHSPVISGDMKTLIFTSRRKGTGGLIEEEDGKFYEDIYICKREDGKWTTPKSISSKINTDGHEASIGLSSDGNTLFIYKAINGGDIFMSEFDGNEWSFPVALNKNINSKYRESHVSISTDKKTLYFASNRPGGIGGMDIYFSELQEDGEWGPAKNLGSKVNSRFNETSPYLQINDSTLVFSSNRKESIGGYDIFYTINQKEGGWTVPENIGYPVNSPDDDFYYVEAPDGSFALYTSNQDGTKGDINLYTILLPEVNHENIAVISGQIMPESDDRKLEEVKISIIDNQTGDTIQTHYADMETGDYTFVLPTGKEYTAVYESEGYMPYIQNMDIQANADLRKTKGAIVLQPIRLGKTGQTYSIGFDNGSSLLTYNSEVELAVVSQAIKDHSSLKGELYVPEDDPLLQRRTNRITRYLTNQNLDTSQVAIISDRSQTGYELFVADTSMLNFKTKGWDLEFNEETHNVEPISKNKLNQITYLLKKDPTLCVQIPVHDNDTTSQKNAETLYKHLTENNIDTSQIIAWQLPPTQLGKNSNTTNVILTEKYFGSQTIVEVISVPTTNQTECGIEEEIIYAVHFSFNGVQAVDVNAINDAIAIMDCPAVEVIVAGHTDAIGSEAYNYKLGKRRAESVKQFLLNNNINSEKVTVVSYGETKPIAQNFINGEDNPEGRSKNRRVEVILKPIE